MDTHSISEIKLAKKKMILLNNYLNPYVPGKILYFSMDLICSFGIDEDFIGDKASESILRLKI